MKTSLRTARAPMMMSTTQVTADARRSSDARNRAIASWIVGWVSLVVIGSGPPPCILGVSPCRIED